MKRQRAPVKNLKKREPPAYQTQAVTNDACGEEPETGIPIPSKHSIQQAKQWVDDHEV